VDSHTLGSAVPQSKPHSTVHVDEQPSLDAELPSSHPSPVVQMPLPHTVTTIGSHGGPPPGPSNPTLQTHWLEELLPGFEVESGGQLMHVSAEVAAIALEYFPPSHAEQKAEPGATLYLPATQLTQGAPL
jgi:hypothetical protein